MFLSLRSGIVALLGLCAGCDALLSSRPAADQVLDVPIDGLSYEQLQAHLDGDALFDQLFTPETGLGPIFDAPSCASCHPGSGRGSAPTGFIRFGTGDSTRAETFNYLTELGGPQLHPFAIPGYAPEVLPPGVNASHRTGPQVVGLGLLEAVPAATLLARSDPDDRDGDGISGRPNYVPVPSFIAVPAACDCPDCRKFPDGCRLLGRFGRKARSISLLQQAARALHDDIGITTTFFPDLLYNPLFGGPTTDPGVPDPKAPVQVVHDLEFYLRTLRPPQRRNADDAQVVRGSTVFVGLGCVSCHVPEMKTGDSPIAPLSQVTFHPYTDLLLHDMGPALADGVPDEQASGSEWRTTPLWGLGTVGNLMGGERYYLHDGRARTIEEAILNHGGEAASRRQRFQQLGDDDRRALLAFLRSL